MTWYLDSLRYVLGTQQLTDIKSVEAEIDVIDNKILSDGVDDSAIESIFELRHSLSLMCALKLEIDKTLERKETEEHQKTVWSYLYQLTVVLDENAEKRLAHQIDKSIIRSFLPSVYLLINALMLSYIGMHGLDALCLLLVVLLNISIPYVMKLPFKGYAESMASALFVPVAPSVLAESKRYGISPEINLMYLNVNDDKEKARGEYEVNASEDETCSIYYTLMRDPVFCTQSYHRYEKKNIVAWIKDHYKNPYTQRPMHVKDLISDCDTRLKIERGISAQRIAHKIKVCRAQFLLPLSFFEQEEALCSEAESPKTIDNKYN